MAYQKIRILLADDHPLIRQGLASFIKAEEDMEIVGEAFDGQDAFEKTKMLQPDIVIMDVSMPLLDGIEATRIICSNFPQIRVIGLSMCFHDHEGGKMRAAGAVDYLCKSGPTEAITAAIRRVAEPLMSEAVI
jgi:DNA-binding NarL/FixJ family response regulator